MPRSAEFTALRNYIETELRIDLDSGATADRLKS